MNEAERRIALENDTKLADAAIAYYQRRTQEMASQLRQVSLAPAGLGSFPYGPRTYWCSKANDCLDRHDTPAAAVLCNALRVIADQEGRIRTLEEAAL